MRRIDGLDSVAHGGQPGHPVGLRMLLGTQLRRLRLAADISREAAADTIRGSESKISRMELGRVGFKERDVADLLTLYRVVDEGERQAMFSLARQANQPGWWHRFDDVLPAWFESYLGLEAAAELIQTYEAQFVPGLLQTRDYARAVIRLGHDAANGFEIERRVDLRADRQALLGRAGAPTLRAVLDESVLRRGIGGADVMRDQIEALAAASTRPNVVIQLVPFQAGGHSAAGGAFTILRFPDPALPDVVYLEQARSALYLDGRRDIDAYQAVMTRLQVEAAPPEQTTDILHTLLRDINGRPGSGSG